MSAELIEPESKEKSGSATLSLSQLPGPDGLPLLGNLLQLSTEKLHRTVEQWSDLYGPIFKIKLATKTVVVITSPALIEMVLKARPEKFRRLGKMDEIIREMGIFGVFNAEGEEWKGQRKFVSQALNMHQLKLFFPTLDSISQKLLKRWKESSGTDIDIKNELMRYTVDITSRLAFGYHMNTIEQGQDLIQEHLENIFPAIFKRVNMPVPYWRFFKMASDRKLDRSLTAISGTLKTIVDKTREQLDQDPSLRQHPANFLQALLAASEEESPVSNQVIVGNILTMLLAGEDTTAHTLAWVFYFMHCNPGVQEKMQKEADRVLGEARTLTRYEDAAQLHYMEAVAFEAMRLKPVAPMLFHDALEDVVIGGVMVPKGTPIFLQTQYASIQEDHFSEASAFWPERWMHGGCPAHKVHDEKAFLPFGGGARFCPGYHLALLEIKAVLSLVARNFHVTMVSEPASVREILAFTMMPSDFLVMLRER